MNQQSDHLTELTVAALADGTLPRAERARAHAHLADCALCREELVVVQGIVHPRTQWRRFVPLSAAAAIAIVAIGIGTYNRSPAPVLRGDEPVPVQVLAPADNAVLAAAPSLSWSPQRDALEYRVTVTNAAGDVAAERVTSEARTTLDALPTGEYHWYVVAMRADGTVISSRARSFHIQ